MAVTRDFKELVQRRVAQDPAFAAALLREGIDTMLAGDVDTGKAILRDYIKATVGFEQLGEATGTPPKSSDPHARPTRQSASAQSVRHHRLSAETGGRRAARRAVAGGMRARKCSMPQRGGRVQFCQPRPPSRTDCLEC